MSTRHCEQSEAIPWREIASSSYRPPRNDELHLEVCVRSEIYAVLHQLDAALAGVFWVITGSVGLALQGVPLEPNDVDIQTDDDGAYEAARRLAAHVTQPVTRVERSWGRSLMGKLDIDGLQVEIIGDIQTRRDDGWEPPPDLASLARTVEADGMRLRVLPLAYEAAAYRRMGRLEKAALIQRYADKEQTQSGHSAGAGGLSTPPAG